MKCARTLGTVTALAMLERQTGAAEENEALDGFLAMEWLDEDAMEQMNGGCRLHRAESGSVCQQANSGRYVC